MRCVPFLVILCVVIVHFGAYAAGNDTDEKLRLDKEIRDLQAVDAAWRSNDAEFRELRKQGQASQTEIREFAEFVAGLKRQVIECCEAVRKLGGDASQHGVDCVKLFDDSYSKKGGVSPDDAKAISALREPTREDKTALLKSTLEKLESDFDGIILIEQNKLRTKGEAPLSSGSWGSDTGDQSEASKTAGADASSGEVAVKSRSKAEPIQHKYEPGAGPGVEKQGKIPDFETGDVGDGSDDDVVARQLREAAEIETDPLLKEQLWKEYKKYKNSTR